MRAAIMLCCIMLLGANGVCPPGEQVGFGVEPDICATARQHVECGCSELVQWSRVVEARGYDIERKTLDPITVLDGAFDDDSEQFEFVGNDATYVSGSWAPLGALVVYMGDEDGEDILDMQGSWWRSFVLGADSDASISVRYRITQSGTFEAGEVTSMVVRVGGVDHVLGEVEGGVQGDPITTGWVTEDIETTLGAGIHLLELQGRLNKKTGASEWCTVEVGSVTVSVMAASAVIVGRTRREYWYPIWDSEQPHEGVRYEYRARACKRHVTDGRVCGDWSSSVRYTGAPYACYTTTTTTSVEEACYVGDVVITQQP